ncbi:MAG: hypothetical protein KAI69_04060, partial [Deltaproteobacteria bacterium]|nr:hypothetical protein [Deltaproteobacteria bacterium]
TVAPPGNQAENCENKPHPEALEETGLLDQRYSKLSNIKAQRDYFKAMDIVMERASIQSEGQGNVE